jgi:hypothetical protein
MRVTWGNNLYGQTDTVPGVFHVATMFFFLNEIPLCPIKTYAVLHTNICRAAESDGRRLFDGVIIPMSWKSVALAYARAVAWAVALAAFFWGLKIVFDSPELSIYTRCQDLAIIILVFGLAYNLEWHGSFRDASYERASEIASAMDRGGPLSDAVQRILDMHFGRLAFATVVTDDLDELELGGGAVAAAAAAAVAPDGDNPTLALPIATQV